MPRILISTIVIHSPWRCWWSWWCCWWRFLNKQLDRTNICRPTSFHLLLLGQTAALPNWGSDWTNPVSAQLKLRHITLASAQQLEKETRSTTYLSALLQVVDIVQQQLIMMVVPSSKVLSFRTFRLLGSRTACLYDDDDVHGQSSDNNRMSECTTTELEIGLLPSRANFVRVIISGNWVWFLQSLPQPKGAQRSRSWEPGGLSSRASSSEPRHLELRLGLGLAMVSVRAKSLGIRVIGSVLGLAVVSLLITLHRFPNSNNPYPPPPIIYLINQGNINFRTQRPWLSF